jgi:AraC-like DNA-binding protein
MKHPLQKSRIPESKAFMVRELRAPHFDKVWHFHSEYQLFLVLEGRGTRFIGDQMQPFREFDFVFTGPNLPHLWRNEQAYFEKDSELQTHGIVIYFPEDFLGEGLIEKEEFDEIRHLFQRAQRGLEITGHTNLKLREKMKDLLYARGTQQLIQFLQILDIISRSSDCRPIAPADYINTNKESERDRMSKVYEYVMDRFSQKIKLADVATLANMTESAFSRYFTSRMNKSFSEFLSDIRISHACKLLHEADKNISEISYESGFNTLSNFNKQFKDRMKVTPLQYKRDYFRTLM